jgi:N-acetylneuraminic acid mutarotase
MRTRLARTAVITTLIVAATACSGNDDDAPARPAAAASCATPGEAAPDGCWEEVLPLGSGGFPPAPGSQNAPLWEPGKFPLTLRPLAAFDDELWMTAQVVAYSSPDGVTWTEHEKTDWGSRIYHAVAFFDDKLWMYGGLDYDGRVFLNDMWSSSDGKTWSNVGTAAWSPRGGQSLVVFDDKLWLFGGANHIASDRSTDGFLQDVWVSEDGLAWTQVTAAAPWDARDNAAVAVLDGALYMLGGPGRTDIWRSTDGRDWEQLDPEADWGPRHDYSHVVFDEKLWVFGGWRDTSTNALNDVWYSADGVRWIRQAEHAPWAPRGPVTTVFRDKIWIYSGKHTGADDNWGGDLWAMRARP